MHTPSESGSHPSPDFTPSGSGSARIRKCYRILAGMLFDSITRTFHDGQVITVDAESGVILDVCAASEPQLDAQALQARLRSTTDENIKVEITEIDLNHLIVLPGFVDVHVHLFLHPYTETSWHDQLTKESLAERTIRATVHAKNTLLAGFTTVRDLGTEGAFDADIALRKCLSGKTPLIIGPRYYCSTRAIVTTGAYGPKSSLYPAEEGIEGVAGAEVADGKDQCTRAVRRQVGAGADWIKIYADYRVRSRMNDVSSVASARSIPTFSRSELEAMITTAHSLGVKVAAHANTAQAIEDLLDLDVDSIEHGGQLHGNKNVLSKLSRAKDKTTWVPTLAAYYTNSLNGSRESRDTWDLCKKTFKEAVFKYKINNIACGGDTGVFAHGQNALELVLMRNLGVDSNRVLSWATIGGWKCVRGLEWETSERSEEMTSVDFKNNSGTDLDRGRPFGAIRVGWAADIMALEGTLGGSAEDFEQAVTKGIRFVMKGGVIHRNDAIRFHPSSFSCRNAHGDIL